MSGYFNPGMILVSHERYDHFEAKNQPLDAIGQLNPSKSVFCD